MLRKELGLEYTDRIRLAIVGTTRVRRVVETYQDALAAEVLAVEVSYSEMGERMEVRELDVDGEAVRIGIARA
jgi:hypothetical protein